MRTSAVYIGDNTVLLKTRHGDKMFVDSRDVGIAPHLILDGDWEHWITSVIGGFLQGSVFFDVGANFGWFTLFGAKYAKEVHAFEPNHRLCSLLRRSISVNGLDKKVWLNCRALGDVEEQRDFGFDVQWMGNGSLSEAATEHGTEAVYVSTLDLYVEEEVDTPLDGMPIVLKIDVEGFEPRVVLGGKNLISRPECTAFVEYHPNACRLAEMLDLFESLQYRMAHVKETAEMVDISREQLASVRPADMLCFYKWRL
jgi:FkbM family methyltransferase